MFNIYDKVFSQPANSGTTIDLIQSIIDYLTELDDRITCNLPDVSHAFDDASATTKIIFSFMNKPVFEIYRNANNGSSTSSLAIAYISNGIEYGAYNHGFTRYSALPGNTLEGDSTVRIKTLISENAIIMYFGWAWSDLPSILNGVFPGQYAVALFKIDDEYRSGYVTGSNIISQGNYRIPSDNTSEYKLKPIINSMAANAGTIYYIPFIAETSNNDIEFFIDSLYSTSSLVVGSQPILANSDVLFAIETNCSVLIN